jgi:threonine/homoserine/homoserine lactone efflux protein
MSAVTELLLGLALGLTLAPPPGPMNAWIASAAVRSYRAGVATGLGAVSADAILGGVVYALDRFVDLEAASKFIYVLGAAVLAYFAYRLLRRSAPATTVPRPLRSFAPALALGLSNPYQILWWLTAGVGFAYVGGAALLVGLFAALLAWVVAFPWVVRAGAKRWPAVERWVRIGSGVALVGFAGYFAVLAAMSVA